MAATPDACADAPQSDFADRDQARETHRPSIDCVDHTDIAQGRTELMHRAVTAHPTAAWVWRRLVEATPWGRRPTHLIRDRDRVYGR